MDRVNDRAAQPGRVVGIGALCDLASDNVASRSFHCQVSEFVVLDSGQQILLYADRGFTSSYVISVDADGKRAIAATSAGTTADGIKESVLMTVLPDDDYKGGPEHPWEMLAQRANAKGVDVTAAELSRLDYEVVLTDKLQRWLDPSH